MKWTKLKEPYKAEIIKDIDLYDEDGHFCASASKQNPIEGTVTHFGAKKVGKNTVRFVLFHLDERDEKGFEISQNWIRRKRDDSSECD